MFDPDEESYISDVQSRQAMTGPDLPPSLRSLEFSTEKVWLILFWFTSVVSALLFWILGSSGLAWVFGISSFLYIAVLTRTLIVKPPFAVDLANIDYLMTPRIGFGTALGVWVAGVALVFILGLAIGTASSVLLSSALLGLLITFVWRDQLTFRVAFFGVILGLSVGLGIVFLSHGDRLWAILNSIALPPIFVAGVLLLERTHLAQSHFVQREYARGLRGFGVACILALPSALLNLLGNVQQNDTWVVKWWQSLYAIVPAMAEETWARLFLTTLCYAFLRPTTNDLPGRAIVCSILFGSMIHGFSHTGINPIGLIIGSLLYGVPTALLLIKCGFEHAVGYHFLIDFVRYLAAWLCT